MNFLVPMESFGFFLEIMVFAFFFPGPLQPPPLGPLGVLGRQRWLRWLPEHQGLGWLLVWLGLAWLAFGFGLAWVWLALRI